MDKLTSIKIKRTDESLSDPIPIGVQAENVIYDDTHNLIDIITGLQQDLNELSNQKAPINHGSTTQVYGIGTLNDYGHVKLSDSYSTTDATTGLVPSPKALSDGLATKAPTNHASTTATYGVATDTKYGHVKIGSNVPLNNETFTVDKVPSEQAVRTAIDNANTAIQTEIDNKDSAIRSTIDTINTNLAAKAPTNHASTSTTYGIGTASNYGHVKISDNYNATGAAASGLVPSQKALNDGLATKAESSIIDVSTPSVTWATDGGVHSNNNVRRSGKIVEVNTVLITSSNSNGNVITGLPTPANGGFYMNIVPYGGGAPFGFQLTATGVFKRSGTNTIEQKECDIHFTYIAN